MREIGTVLVMCLIAGWLRRVFSSCGCLIVRLARLLTIKSMCH